MSGSPQAMDRSRLQTGVHPAVYGVRRGEWGVRVVKYKERATPRRALHQHRPHPKNGALSSDWTSAKERRRNSERSCRAGRAVPPSILRKNATPMHTCGRTRGQLRKRGGASGGFRGGMGPVWRVRNDGRSSHARTVGGSAPRGMCVGPALAARHAIGPSESGALHASLALGEHPPP